MGKADDDQFEAMGIHMFGDTAERQTDQSDGTLSRERVRKQMLAKIHIGKKQLGLDEDTYRELLLRVTGKASAKDMTHEELLKVLAEMRSKGFTPRTADGRTKTLGEQTYLPKLRALWISGFHLGVVDDVSEEAMFVFIKRQTGVDHPRWLQEHDRAMAAIEGLKSWLAREARVDWRSYPHHPQGAVIYAQLRMLADRGVRADYDAEAHFTAEEYDAEIRRLGRHVRGEAD